MRDNENLYQHNEVIRVLEARMGANLWDTEVMKADPILSFDSPLHNV